MIGTHDLSLLRPVPAPVPRLLLHVVYYRYSQSGTVSMQLYQNLLLNQKSSLVREHYMSKIYQFVRNCTAKDDPVLQLSYQLVQLGTRQQVLGTQHLVLGTRHLVVGTRNQPVGTRWPVLGTQQLVL